MDYKLVEMVRDLDNLIEFKDKHEACDTKVYAMLLYQREPSLREEVSNPQYNILMCQKCNRVLEDVLKDYYLGVFKK